MIPTYPMTTTKLMKLSHILCLPLFALALGCSRTPVDPPQEDYAKLFPFTGPEKPSPRYEEMIPKLGNPETTPASFVYPGVIIPGLQRTYTVRLSYTFAEPADLSQGDGLNAPEDVRSKVYIRYVDADKQLRSLGSEPSLPVAERLTNDGKPHTLTFTLSTGQPLYLQVGGYALRGTTLNVSLQATSTDGIFVTPTLLTEQSQHADEGNSRLPNPFCQYIILP